MTVISPSIVPYILRQTPEMTPEEIAYLDAATPAGCRVWEWGSGGSTLWFLGKGCRVTAIEHMPISYQLIILGLSGMRLGKDVLDLRYVPADVSYIDGADHDGTAEQFRLYADAYNWEGVEVFLIDGRARLACLERLRKFNLVGARVLLHDASRYDYTGIAEKVGGVGELHELRLKP